MKRVLVLFVIFFISAQLFAQMSDDTRVSTEKTYDDYLADLDSSDPNVVVNACMWLGDKEKKESASKVMGLITASDPNVRMWSAVTLGRFYHKDALNPIIDQLMVETNPDVRYAQIISVTRIGLENNDDTRSKLQQLKNRETDPFIIDYINKMEVKYGMVEESASE